MAAASSGHRGTDNLLTRPRPTADSAAMDVTHTIDAYADAWNELDASQRSDQLAEVIAQTGTSTDPRFQVSGRGRLVEHISGYQEPFPDARMERRSRVDACGAVARFAWAIVVDDAPVREGVDFVPLDDHGKIVPVTGFFRSALSRSARTTDRDGCFVAS